MATSSKLLPLMSDHKRYESTFSVFCERSRNVEVLEDWIKSYFTEKIMTEIKVKETNELMVMGVGSGAGQDESKVLKQLLKKWPKIKDTVVEPNLGLISRYQDLAAMESKSIAGVSFDWRNQTLRQFRQEQPSDQQKYHFIMLFHVLYFIDDVEGTLKYLKSILADGGILLVLIEGDECCFPRVFEKIPQIHNNMYHGISTRYIEQILTTNQMKSVKHQIKFNLDATGCFDDDSEEGELLIEFLTQIAYLKKHASESLYIDIIDHCKSLVLPKTEDGKLWLRCDGDAIVIRK